MKFLLKFSEEKKAFIYLFIGMVLFSLEPILLKVIIEVGLEVREAGGLISFCNILFVRSICAGVVPALFIRRADVHEFVEKKKTLRDCVFIGITALLAFAYPTLIFFAIQLTNIINVIILNQVESFFYFTISFLIYRFFISKQEIIGNLIVIGGLTFLFIFNTNGYNLGDFLATIAIGTVVFLEILRKQLSKIIPITILNTMLNLISAILFFVLAVIIFGIEHFASLTSVKVWLWVGVYAIFSVAFGQYFWVRGLRHATNNETAINMLLQPVFSVLFASLLLREIPSELQFIVIGIVLVGLTISTIKSQQPANNNPNLHL